MQHAHSGVMSVHNDMLSLGPYKESVTSDQIQMPFHAVGRSFRPSGGSYAPDMDNTPRNHGVRAPLHLFIYLLYMHVHIM